MPVSEYYSGHGVQVMHDMIKRYGEKKGKEVFYATANKRKSDKPRKRVKSTEDTIYDNS